MHVQRRLDIAEAGEAEREEQPRRLQPLWLKAPMRCDMAMQ